MLRGLVALAAALACVVAQGAATAYAQSSPPSLRLHAGSSSATIHRYGRQVPLDLPVFVASSGGDFQLNVFRPDYDSPRMVNQVDSQTGAVLRTLPREILQGWRGLKDFMRVGLRTRDGRLVAWRTLDFCPNSGGSGQRVNDDGPPFSRYPFYCGAGSPFTRGMVWGIDEGWAVSALGSGEYGKEYGSKFGYKGEPVEDKRFIRVPNGRYVATVRILPRYAQLFGLTPEASQVTVAVRITGEIPKGSPGEPVPIDGDGSGMGRATAGQAGSDPVPTVENPDPSTLPDLVATPAWQVRLMRQRGGREFLGFAATPWNAGPAPIVVEGFRKPTEDLMDAYQYFLDANAEVVGRTHVGSMEYDHRRGHEHWHFLQFSSYVLLDANRQEVVRSRKQAFCLAPTDAIDLTLGRTNLTPSHIGFGGSVCGGLNAIWVREQLDVGWGDTYYQGVPGQSFEVTNLPNGRYYIRIDVNPQGVLKEASMANNTEFRTVDIVGPKGKRRAVMHAWHSIRQ